MSHGHTVRKPDDAASTAVMFALTAVASMAMAPRPAIGTRRVLPAITRPPRPEPARVSRVSASRSGVIGSNREVGTAVVVGDGVAGAVVDVDAGVVVDGAVVDGAAVVGGGVVVVVDGAVVVVVTRGTVPGGLSVVQG